MSTSFVSAASAESDTVAMPSHQAGDLICVWAVSPISGGPPTIPADYFTLDSRAVGSRSCALAFKIAETSSEVTGTFANAILVSIGVWRHATNYLLPGERAAGSGVTTSINYGLVVSRGVSSWFAGFGMTASNALAVDTPPSGMTSRTSLAGTSDGELLICDTNEDIASWPFTLVALGASNGWLSNVIELWDSGIEKAGGGGIYNPFRPPVFGGR